MAARSQVVQAPVTPTAIPTVVPILAPTMTARSSVRRGIPRLALLAGAGVVALALGATIWIAAWLSSGSSRTPAATPAAPVPVTNPPKAAAAGEKYTDADSPEVQAAAREALARAKVLDIVGKTRDIVG